MLTKIEIQNYRCFPSLEVELRPLTLLIGPNNTGKSAFLEAIRRLENKNTDFTVSDYWRMSKDTSIEIRAYVEGFQSPILIRSPQPNDRQRHIDLDDQTPSIGPVWFFRLPSEGVSCSHDGFAEAVKELALGVEGESLASVLDYMLRKDRKKFDGVITTLRKLVPGFEDLAIDTPDAKSRHLSVVLDNGLELPGEALSVGLRHLIFFVTLAYHPRAPQIILLEEPELGVHPSRLGDIMRLLRSISKGEFCDHPAQVILTTHSPFLLDHVDLDHDQLLIFQREEDGARNAYPADKERLKHFLDEFMLGEVWLNEEEEGLIGKR